MEKILTNGTKVLLFNHDSGELNFIKGVVINKEEKELLSLAGDILLRTNYIIETENGEIVKAFYGNSYDGYYIKTTEDYLNDIKNYIDKNIKDINKLNNLNAKLYNIAYSLSPKDEEIIKNK